MAFIVRKTKHRAWPVTVTLLVGDDAGQVQTVESTFVAHFRPFSEASFEQFCDEAIASHPAPEGGSEESLGLPTILRRNAELFSRVMVGWGPDVCDEQGESIPFSLDMLTAMVTGADGVAFSAGINAALGQMRFGRAPAKNAETSPAPGPMAGADEAAPTN